MVIFLCISQSNRIIPSIPYLITFEPVKKVIHPTNSKTARFALLKTDFYPDILSSLLQRNNRNKGEKMDYGILLQALFGGLFQVLVKIIDILLQVSLEQKNQHKNPIFKKHMKLRHI
jgi:hypothetical protein